MANKNIFKSGQAGVTPAATNTVNRAGGAAYALSEKAALAQYAATGTFNDTFYSTGEMQVAEVLTLAAKVDVQFIGKVILYSRDQGRMKDMPALLAAHLTTRGSEGMAVLKSLFLTAIDNGKMLRNFFQIMRSGVVGRKSLGTAPKKLLQSWFSSKAPQDIFKMSTGNEPSLADVLYASRTVDAGSPERKALFAYMLDREYDFDSLPSIVKEYELLKKWIATPSGKTKAEIGSLPKVPFEMLMGIGLDDKGWRLLADQMSWTQIRMNLNTLSRHGAFKDAATTKMLVTKLSDPRLIEKAKPFPYQIFSAYLNTKTDGEEAVPVAIKNALHDALEVSAKIVPTFEGKTYVAVDTSGSMCSPVTGSRAGATTTMSCVQVASLIACTFLKKNRESEIMPFDTRLHMKHGMDPNDSIMTNASKLSKFGGGGTDCGLALADLNSRKAKGDLVIYVSDNESWMDGGRQYGRGTSMANEWSVYKARNPKAKLVCIDLATAATVQVGSDPNVLNVGGFSDTIWEVIKSFVEGAKSADYWVEVIEATQLPAQA